MLVAKEWTHHVLLGNVALHITVWMLILEDLGEGQVVGIPVKRHNAFVVSAQLGQCRPVRFPCGDLWRDHLFTGGLTDTSQVCVCLQEADLFSSLVTRRTRHPDVPQAHRRRVLDGGGGVQVLAAVCDATLQVFDHHVGHVLGEDFGVPPNLVLCSWNHTKAVCHSGLSQ